MVVVLFGQPHSGKTTLADSLCELHPSFVKIDGDKLREIFKNKDFSREGRIKNLQKASDISAFLNSEDKNVVCSLVYPYKESRDYLRDLVPNSKWVYLHYEGERGREKFHVSDFDFPQEEQVLVIDTSVKGINECLIEIVTYLNEENESENIS